MKNRGQTLTSALIGTLILAVAFLFSLSAFTVTPKASDLSSSTLMAEAYAAELLELFVSNGQANLNTYLSNNPLLATCPSCNPYFLCAHINLLDRTDAITLNADPLAELVHPNPLDGKTPQTYANRYYQVEAINLQTAPPSLVPAGCGTAFGTYSLTTPNQYLVSVGVSWIPQGASATKGVQRVVLSAPVVMP